MKNQILHISKRSLIQTVTHWIQCRNPAGRCQSGPGMQFLNFVNGHKEWSRSFSWSPLIEALIEGFNPTQTTIFRSMYSWVSPLSAALVVLVTCLWNESFDSYFCAGQEHATKKLHISSWLLPILTSCKPTLFACLHSCPTYLQSRSCLSFIRTTYLAYVAFSHGLACMFSLLWDVTQLDDSSWLHPAGTRRRRERRARVMQTATQRVQTRWDTVYSHSTWIHRSSGLVASLRDRLRGVKHWGGEDLQLCTDVRTTRGV